MSNMTANNTTPCFTPGTLIATMRGEVPVESLQPGDRVITRDNGLQDILWVGRCTLNREELSHKPERRPVWIRAGSLGPNLPEHDLLLSPQHRILLIDDSVYASLDEREVLVDAKSCSTRKGVDTIDATRVTYIHFMCRSHEVVLANGAWTESFRPDVAIMDDLGEAMREEIFAIFPELAMPEPTNVMAPARFLAPPAGTIIH